MTAEDVFNETLKSPELQEIYNIPIDEIKNESYYSKSKHEIIEVIRTLLISKLLTISKCSSLLTYCQHNY